VTLERKGDNLQVHPKTRCVHLRLISVPPTAAGDLLVADPQEESFVRGTLNVLGLEMCRSRPTSTCRFRSRCLA
jgi:hypothetical protein